MAVAIQRMGHEEPWAAGEPQLTVEGVIAIEWTAEPEKVWTTEAPPDALLVQALDASVVHWGSLPDPEPEPVPAEEALDELIEVRAKAGDETAIQAREARSRERGEVKRG